jgi:hypothetical protein
MTVPGDEGVAALLAGLEGLEQQPLAVQAERLDAIRQRLDSALARPADGPVPPTTGHG